MKTKIAIACLTGIVLGISNSFAQDQVEALKFSQRFIQSDARSLGVGNAFGAVGANFVCTTINPAGLALYRKSEFNFSLGFANISSQSTYLGSLNSDRKFNLNLPELGIIGTKIRKDNNGQPIKTGWTSYSFGLGIVRTNSYYANKYMEGINTSNSVLSSYAEAANGIASTNLSLNTAAGLAWDTYLIDPDTLNSKPNQYKSILKDTSLNLGQSNSLSTRGSSYDINISFAGNYSDIIMIGASLNIPTINYHESREFKEVNRNNDANKEYISSEYDRSVDITGVGIQATFGIIIKPIQYFRIGGSIQTPAFFNNLHSTYSQEMKSNLTSRGELSTKSDGEYDFNFTSPFRINGSAAVIIGKYGFISFDYEMADYSQSLYGPSSDFNDANKNISNYYDIANNYHFGAEFKLDIFAIRGGYSIYGSPYRESIKKDLNGGDGSATSLTFGFGIREKSYFADIAYEYLKTKEYYLPYRLALPETVAGAVDDLTKNKVILTFGVRF